MLILAVDSATPVAGVALLDGEKIIAEYFTNFKRVHSQSLMPMIDKCLSDCGCSLNGLDAIALTTGPGSFTGIRIGMATVKGLCLGADIPLIGVSTLDVIANNMFLSNYLVCPVLNARKNEVYTAVYDVSKVMPQLLWGPEACSPEVLAAKAMELAAGRSGIVLLGDGYLPFQQYFRQTIGSQLIDAPPHLMLPRASSAASLARRKFEKGLLEDVHSIRPYYIRLSEAEYKLGKEDR